LKFEITDLKLIGEEVSLEVFTILMPIKAGLAMKTENSNF